MFRKNDFALPLTGECEITESVIIGIAPEAIRVVPEGQGMLQGLITLVEPRGPEVVLTVALASVALKVVMESASRPPEGTAVGLSVDLELITLFSGETGQRIAALRAAA
jgi:multiple sugar transport system ATP-binding protein